MTTIHDPEELLRSLSQRPVDTQALAAAGSDVDQRIAALSRGERVGLTADTVRRRTRPALLIAAAAAVVMVVAAVGLSFNRSDRRCT
ncbi:MAG: hypothetical protein ACK5H2_05910 [Beutenbergiaceae bacterium]